MAYLETDFLQREHVMGHRIRAFVGTAAALKRFASVRSARAYALEASSGLLVVPLDEELHDALHELNGTGDWPDTPGPLLSTSDYQFAARASDAAPLAYVETDYFGGEGLQHAILWQNGVLAVGPLTLDVQSGAQRPTSLWPINVVLRALGVAATLHEDEFTRLGLGRYRDNERIHEKAEPRPLA